MCKNNLDNNLDVNKVTKYAVEHFGVALQFMVAQEECGELITAISHFIRGRRDKYGLAEEIADVEIMCMQLRHMVGNETVDIVKNKKLIRLAERCGLHKAQFGDS